MLNVIDVNSEMGSEEYNTLLTYFDDIEPYYLLNYIEVFGGGLKNLICYSFQSERSNSQILMPGYLNPIEFSEGNLDFITPYGYTGPLMSDRIDETDIQSFWYEVESWNKKKSVVTQFIRFNLSNNHRFYNGEIFSPMLNIRGLIINEEMQWKAFEYKVRKNVKNALRENLTCSVYHNDIEDNNIVEFYNIYIGTMLRTKAKEDFMYSLGKLTEFIKNNGAYTAICTIYDKNIPISSELLLVSNTSIYSFLGGTDEDYFNKRPNDFLKVQVINWARKNKKMYYVLGGGYGVEDGIFKYKKSFFPNDVVKYFTGRHVIDKSKYRDLVNVYNNLREMNGLDILHVEKEIFFPLYNLQIKGKVE